MHRATLLVVFFLAGWPRAAISQTEGGGAGAHQHHQMAGQPVLFDGREISGTAWQPQATPMFAAPLTAGGWQIMLHGNAFAQLVYEPGDRHRTGGAATHQISSVNWIMGMARRSVGEARLGLRAMASVEPWTVSDCGFLNLLASGEICDGDTIHDRQHPHDLFMELAADYDRPIGQSWRWQVYGGLAGEPALGPGGFPHRFSAVANPVAPITHHWIDSTHVAFGLVTTGVYNPRWKAEASLFNGREPDAERADIDLGPLDSVSGRVSYMPAGGVTLQVSAAHLREAEEEFPPTPREDVTRVTASALLLRGLPRAGVWETTIAYGMNSGAEPLPEGPADFTTHALLVETNALLSDRDTWFGRWEIAGKPAHDLHAHEFEDRVFTVSKLQVGYLRALERWRGLTPGIGATFSINVVPGELASRYDGRVAPGVAVFFNLRPNRHTMGS